MADGYARTTGRIGVCLMVPGPGLLNASAALATAYACSSPVLCLTGQVDSRGIDQHLGMLHEVPHQLEIMGSFTKWARRALSPGEVPWLAQEASRQIRSGRPRPAGLEVPPDVLLRREEVQSLSAVPDETSPGDPGLRGRNSTRLRS